MHIHMHGNTHSIALFNTPSPHLLSPHPTPPPGKAILSVILAEKEADDLLAAEALRRQEEQARAMGKPTADKSTAGTVAGAAAGAGAGGKGHGPPSPTHTHPSHSHPTHTHTHAQASHSTPPTRIKYDVSVRNVFDYTASTNPIKSFLERVTFMMSGVLSALVRRAVVDFARTYEELCACEVVVKGIRDIRVGMGKDSIYLQKVLPPLFSVSFRVTLEDRVLNQVSE